MARNKYDFDLIVIGSGASGGNAASTAAREGKRVAIVETDAFGGVSANWGDIPTKALLHAAHLYDSVRHGAAFGLRASALGYNFLSLKAWKDHVIKQIGVGSSRKHLDVEGVTTLHGTAHFISDHEINVNRQVHTSESFLIATGARQFTPDITGLADAGHITPRQLLDLSRPPKSLFIIGGGHIAVELGQLMAIFGTKVYIAEVAPYILSTFDAEAGETMAKFFEERYGMTILTKTKTLAVENENIARRVTYSRGGVEHTVRVDEVMVAAGRVPNVDMGLENAGVRYNKRGIETNNYMQTTAKNIYAAGDVTGINPYTHAAIIESRTAVNNIMSKNKFTYEYDTMPRTIFTEPGVASVGLTESDCIKRDLPIRKSIVPLSMVTRSATSNSTDGFVKIITSKKGIIIGATIVAPDASELIHELTLAVKHAMTATQLAATPHTFLSWSEAIRLAAAKLA